MEGYWGWEVRQTQSVEFRLALGHIGTRGWEALPIL